MREELLELAVELRGQRLVMRHDERGAAEFLDDVRRGECLSRSRHTEKRLVSIPGGKRACQARDRPRLITLRIIFRL